jgi:hypothetical protein
MIETLSDPTSRDRAMLIIMLISHIAGLVVGILSVFAGFGLKYWRDEMEIRREIRYRKR